MKNAIRRFVDVKDGWFMLASAVSVASCLPRPEAHTQALDTPV